MTWGGGEGGGGALDKRNVCQIALKCPTHGEGGRGEEGGGAGEGGQGGHAVPVPSKVCAHPGRFVPMPTNPFGFIYVSI